MTRVANRIAPRTSDDARNTTSSADRRSPSGLLRSSRSRRKTFSTSMIASSTSAPMAIVKPPSVIVFSVPPNSDMVRTPTTSERGMATAEMSVVRRLPRKRNRMISTRIAPSRRATETLWMATSMKSACRKFSFSMTTPAGSVFSTWARTPSSVRVSSSVLASGCFWTLRMTAGRAR